MRSQIVSFKVFTKISLAEKSFFSVFAFYNGSKTTENKRRKLEQGEAFPTGHRIWEHCTKSARSEGIFYDPKILFHLLVMGYPKITFHNFSRLLFQKSFLGFFIFFTPPSFFSKKHFSIDFLRPILGSFHKNHLKISWNHLN